MGGWEREAGESHGAIYVGKVLSDHSLGEMLGDVVLDTHAGDWAVFAPSKLSPEHPMSRGRLCPWGTVAGSPSLHPGWGHLGALDPQEERSSCPTAHCPHNKHSLRILLPPPSKKGKEGLNFSGL